MSVLTEYVKSMYAENILKLLHFAASVDCVP